MKSMNQTTKHKIPIVEENGRRGYSISGEVECEGFSQKQQTDWQRSAEWHCDRDLWRKIGEEREKEAVVPSSKEWLAIFPEAVEIINEMIEDRKVQLGGAQRRLQGAMLRAISGNALAFATIDMAKEEIAGLNSELGRLQLYVEKVDRAQGSKVPDIQELKRKTPMTDLASRYGVKSQKFSNKWRALCPFHKEKTPSFFIFQNSYHCFGCGEHGDQLDFIQKMDGCSIQEAINKLNK